MNFYCRSILLAALVGGCFWSSSAWATTYLYEPFDYSSGVSLQGLTNASGVGTASGKSWLQAGSANPPSVINTTAGSLTPTNPGDLVAPIGNSLAINGVGNNSGSTNRLALGTLLSTASTLYYSFEINVNSLSGSNNTTGGFFLSLNNTGNSSQTTNPTVVPGRVQMRIDPTDATKFDLGIFTNRPSSGAAALTAADPGWSGPLSLNQTIFVVGAIDYSATTNNKAQMWINPDPASFGLPTAPAADRTDNTGTTISTGIQSVLVRQSPAPFLTLDELRVASTWGEVTPISTPTLYWDIDGANPGSGGATPSGTWDAGTQNWSNGVNGDVGPQAWTANAKAVFSAGSDATGAYTITISGTQSAASVTFKDGTPTLTGGTLNLVGAHTLATTSAGQTVAVASVIGGSVGLNKDGAGTVVLTANETYSGPTSISTGTIQLGNGGTTGTLPTSSAIANNGTFAVNRSNAVTQGTDFSGAAITGTGGLTQAGSGTLTLNAANTFSGTTRAMAGTLLLTNSLALQNSTLDLNGADTGAVVFDSSLTAATVGGLTGSRDRALTNASSAALALTVGNNNTTAGPYSGALSGGGSLTKVGTGAQKISGNNTYSGGTNINAGTLQFGQTLSMPLTGAVAVNSSGTLAVNVGGSSEWTNSSVPTDPASIASLIAGTGGRGTLNQVTWNSGSALGIDTTNAAAPVTYSANIGNFNGTNNSVGLTKLGAGTLQISGANTYTGQTTIGAGTSTTASVLKMGATNTLPASTVVVLPTTTNSNARLELFDDSSISYDQTIAGLSGGGGGTFATAANVNVGFATLTINTAANQNYTYDGFLTTDSDIFDDTHHGRVVKNGDGGLTITANNGTPPFKGEFIMNAGTLGIGNNQSFGPTTGITSKLTINGGTLANTTGSSLNLSVRNIDINGSFTFNLSSANDSQMLGNAGLQTVTLNADTTITEVPSAVGNQNALIWAGTLTDNASGPARSLTKMGTGLMTLVSSANSYRGNTIIKEGILRVGKTTTANVPAGGGRMGDGNGTVYLSGGTLTYNGSLGTSDSTRTITVPNPVVMDASSSISYISTTADLAGLNDISFIFSNNSIAGTAGTLTINNLGTSTTSKFRPQFSGSGFNFSRPIVIDSGTSPKTTTLESTNSSGTQTWSGSMSGSGGYRRSDVGSTVFTGSNSFLGGTIVDGGVLTVTGSSATFGGGDVTVNAGNAAISAGVANAIANTAKLTLLGGGMAGAADVGYIALASGINERVTALVLGATGQADGTYGSTASLATFKNDEYFSGTGIITVGPAGLPGDFNSDGKVDAGDYATWRKNDAANVPLANDNGVGTQAARFSLWRANFGNPPGAGSGGGLSGGGSTVPEPGTLSLLIFAVGSLVTSSRLSRRRRG